MAVATWALTRAEVRSSLASVAASFAHPKVSGVILAGAFYSTTVIWGLSQIGFWEAWMLKDTIYWFLGTAVVLKVQTPVEDERFFRNIAGSVLTVSVVVQFLVNLYAFPLYVEIWLVPLLVMVGGCLALAQADSRYEPARKALETLVVMIALVLLSFSLAHMLQDIEAFASLDTARAFLLAPVLTITFLPLLYVFAVVAAYELVFMRLSRALRNNGLLDRGEQWAVRLSVVRACGLRLSRLKRFSPTVMPRIFAADSTEDVRAAVSDFRATQSTPETERRLAS